MEAGKDLQPTKHQSKGEEAQHKTRVKVIGRATHSPHDPRAERGEEAADDDLNVRANLKASEIIRQASVIGSGSRLAADLDRNALCTEWIGGG